MPNRAKFIPLAERRAYHCFEDVVGCKWSAAVIAAVSQGVQRPGALERFIPGISTKVLNERLRRLVSFGLLSRKEFEGLPPRVDYSLTPTGRRLARTLKQLRDMNLGHAPAEDRPASRAHALRYSRTRKR